MDNNNINLTDIQKETVVNCGAFNYSSEKIANILDLDISIITRLLSDTNSSFYKLYKKGIDMYDYSIDLKLFEMARGGI